jgi:predicted RNA-binding protein with TRAM domain
MPISDLKQQPVKPGEELVVEVTDIHESGAGVGRTEDGFIVLVDGTLPPARARVRIDRVKANHATAAEVERLPMDEDDDADADADAEASTADDGASDGASRDSGRPEQLGSRDNFWGG